MKFERLFKIIRESIILVFKIIWILVDAVIGLFAYRQVEVVNMPDEIKQKQSTSKAEEIQKLHALKEQGVLTQEEFEKEKKKVLEA